MTNIKKSISVRLIRYFMQGLLIVTPISFTFYLSFKILDILDHIIPESAQELLKRIFHFHIPGLGVVIVVGIITSVGFLASSFFAKPILDFVENILKQIPLINFIYSSFKDFVDAFVGNNKKFRHPVLIKLNNDSNLSKLGFITQDDLDFFQIKDKIAVYVPHSYNFSGDLFIVNKESVTKVDASGAEVMKFIVSGGVTGFHTEEDATTAVK